MLLKDPSKALEAYDLAKQNAPEDAYVLLNRGNALVALGRTEEAKAEYRAVLLKSNRKSAVYALAKAALARGE